MSKKIAIIGGSGALGAGLAKRWAKAGHLVVVGSRDAGRAAEAAVRLNQEAGTSTITGAGNPEAAATSEIVVLTVPYANQMPTLEAISSVLDGKILVDVTVPLVPPKVRTVHVPEGGVRVVSAFQNVAATHLDDLDHAIDCDVLVCGNDPTAREEIVQLARDADMKAWHAGVIANSIVAEALTSTLIFMNARYKIDGAGIRMTGEPGSANAEETA
jgi:NADPH-dependent F420 reductase